MRPSVRTYLLALQAATVIPLAALFAFSLYRSGQKDMAAAFYGALLWLGLSLWAHRRSARTAAEPVDPRS